MASSPDVDAAEAARLAAASERARRALQAAQEQHPERAVPAKTEQERNRASASVKMWQECHLFRNVCRQAVERLGHQAVASAPPPAQAVILPNPGRTILNMIRIITA
jgi:hypothetical protein